MNRPEQERERKREEGKGENRGRERKREWNSVTALGEFDKIPTRKIEI